MLPKNKNSKKRLLSLFLSIIMIAGVMPAGLFTFAADSELRVNGKLVACWFDTAVEVSKLPAGIKRDPEKPAALKDGQVWSGKQVKYNNDGTFTITLSAWGSKFKVTPDGKTVPLTAPMQDRLVMTDVIRDFDFVGFINQNGAVFNSDANTVTWILTNEQITTAQPISASFTVKLKPECSDVDVWYYTNKGVKTEFTPHIDNNYYWTYEITDAEIGIGLSGISWNEGNAFNNYPDKGVQGGINGFTATDPSNGKIISFQNMNPINEKTKGSGLLDYKTFNKNTYEVSGGTQFRAFLNTNPKKDFWVMNYVGLDPKNSLNKVYVISFASYIGNSLYEIYEGYIITVINGGNSSSGNFTKSVYSAGELLPINGNYVNSAGIGVVTLSMNNMGGIRLGYVPAKIKIIKKWVGTEGKAEFYNDINGGILLNEGENIINFGTDGTPKQFIIKEKPVNGYKLADVTGSKGVAVNNNSGIINAEPGGEYTITFENREIVPYTIEYYKDIISDENKLGETTGKGALGDWIPYPYIDVINMHRPTGYKEGTVQEESSKWLITEDVENNVIKILYVKDIFKYRVEYYYDGEIDGSLTERDTALYGAEITKYKDKIIAGYKFEKDTAPLTIGEITLQNVIKVYYVKDDSQTKKLSYKVEYYKDGVHVAGDDIIIEETVWINAANELTVRAVDKKDGKYVGYEFGYSDPAVIPKIIEDGGVIRIYYVKADFGYRVEYYYDGIIDNSKTDRITATYGDIIENYTDKIITGYKFEKKENCPLTISENPANNVIKVYYVKDDFDYKVEYYYDGKLIESKTDIFTATYGDEITNYTDKPITGYKFERDTGPLTVGANSNNNVIKVYYVKADYEYKVEYYYDAVIDKSKTDIKEAEYESVIDSYTDKIITGYKFQKDENCALTISAVAANNIIKVYYVKDSFNYRVGYYYDGKIDDSKTETFNATYGDIIENYKDKPETGYKFDRDTGTLIVSSVIENNVIKVYYVKDETQTKTIKYTVKYYKDGEHVAGDDIIIEETVWINAPDTLKVKDFDKKSNKYTGYEFAYTDPPVIPDVIENGGVIKVYYEKDAFRYRVEYYYDGVIDSSKTDRFKAIYGEEIKTYKDKIITGYKFERATAPLKISDKVATNVIRVYYVRESFDYTIKYYYDGKIDESKTVELTAKFGDIINKYTDKNITGYKLESDTAPLTIGEKPENNIIKVYYVKDEFAYTVKYYYDGIEDTEAKIIEMAKFGDVINKYEDKVINGYKLETVENCPLKISEIIEDNIISVYYVRAEFGYTVEYYYDGKIDNSKTINIPAVYGDKIETYPDKNITGYKLESDTAPLIVSDKVAENVIKVYYVKDSFDYTVEYYYDGKIDDSKTEILSATFGDKITGYPDKSTKKYIFVKAENVPMTISVITANNIIRVYYEYIPGKLYVTKIEKEADNSIPEVLQTFEFTITDINGVAVRITKDENIVFSGTGTVRSEAAGKFTLTSGETAVISGLADGDYIITETTDTVKYNTAVKVDAKNAGTNTSVKFKMENGEDRTVEFTNTKNTVLQIKKTIKYIGYGETVISSDTADNNLIDNDEEMISNENESDEKTDGETEEEAESEKLYEEDNLVPQSVVKFPLEFTFTLKDANGNAVDLSKFVVRSDRRESDDMLVGGGIHGQFTLMENETVTIYGLELGDKYIITETDPEEEGMYGYYNIYKNGSIEFEMESSTYIGFENINEAPKPPKGTVTAEKKFNSPKDEPVDGTIFIVELTEVLKGETKYRLTLEAPGWTNSVEVDPGVYVITELPADGYNLVSISGSWEYNSLNRQLIVENKADLHIFVTNEKTPPAKTSAEISGTNVIIGNPDKIKQFKFNLKELNTNNPGDFKEDGIILTETVSGEGPFGFTIKDLPAGTYYFQINEEADEENYWTLDSHNLIIMIVVTENGGIASAVVTVLDDNVFTNIYLKPGILPLIGQLDKEEDEPEPKEIIEEPKISEPQEEPGKESGDDDDDDDGEPKKIIDSVITTDEKEKSKEKEEVKETKTDNEIIIPDSLPKDETSEIIISDSNINPADAPEIIIVLPEGIELMDDEINDEELQERGVPLANGWFAVDLGNNYWEIFDENGVPLGVIYLSDNEDIQTLDIEYIEANITPLANIMTAAEEAEILAAAKEEEPAIEKAPRVNPKTRDNLIYLFFGLLICGYSGVIIRKKMTVKIK